MKIYNKQISVLSKTDTDGTITPLRWQIEDEESNLQAYKILNVMNRKKTRVSGNITYEIFCETEIQGTKRPCELRYNMDTAQWYLFKI